MKKILIIILFMFVLVGCKTTPTEPIETEIPSVPNNLQPLSAVSDCDVPTLQGGWVCIWADEFNGNVVDETKWTFEVGGFGGGNQEVQYYSRHNTEVVDSKLVITALRETMGGKQYTSSRLNTKYKGSFKYVRIVVSAKMPTGRGTWPAIWMMPLMNAYGVWPRSGEIDIMEYVGYDKDKIHSTIHTEKFNHNLGTQLGYSRVYEGVETSFKEYEMIWSPGSITTYVDGNKLGEFAYVPHFNQDVPYNQVFPFDQEFFLIINLAIGGTWGGAQGIDNTIFPTTMEVDYVRVYKQDYAVLDKEAPTVPTNLSLAQLKNTIFWNKSNDDYGVEKYAVYLDGAFHKYASLNQITFTGLTASQIYQVQIQAVDFVGRTSDMSETMLLTFSG
ncbi:MAG: glycoside hydrolase family 16 protein [Acholeplasmataceae bacterium]|nr:glycoside hydrolase family 16 protein [Acholeplasmataceae bacterium]